MSQKRVKRALLSVFDKTGIVDFAQTLVEEFGIEIISTGGTAGLLKESGIPVTLVEAVTGFPEIMEGRVKTLHPKIHAAILADRDNPEHMRRLAEQGIEPIDMVVVNLYPFEKTVADPNCTFEQGIEMIDIGGPCMLRAAAKNHKHVVVCCSDLDHEVILDTLRISDDSGIRRERMREWASRAFCVTHLYDAQVHAWLEAQDERDQWCPDVSLVRLHWPDVLRYGENPHLPGAMYERGKPDGSFLFEAHLVKAHSGISATHLSYNNYADGHAALELCKELTRGLCSTGFGSTEMSSQSSKQKCVAPASSRWSPVEGDRQTERNLPHLETTGRSYFVTFRTKCREFSEKARDIVLESCKYWHGKKMNLHALVVMPDHVHLLVTPFEVESGGAVSLGKLIHSIKSYSANQVNKLEGRAGTLWLDERRDRIMRNEKEFIETWEYIEANPDRAGLGKDYRWFWRSSTGFKEAGIVHRLEAGATQEVPSRRLETGATRGVSCCVFIKHTNACGVGVAKDQIEAYRQAYLGDPNAAMGGVLACNFDVNADFATVVMETYARFGKETGAGGFFLEVWIAPTFDEDALETIRKTKKWGERVRLLTVGDMSGLSDEKELEYKSITGGMLVQSRDILGLNEDQWKVVTKRQPSDQELDDLRLAWLVCKHTKSNAISICKDNMLIGNGAGQTSRVMSCRIATWLAQENGHQAKLPGSVAASDAFFPFPDGPSILMDAGVTAIIQPGGSKRDDETIKACNGRDVAMIMTGTRHFKH